MSKVSEGIAYAIRVTEEENRRRGGGKRTQPKKPQRSGGAALLPKVPSLPEVSTKVRESV